MTEIDILQEKTEEYIQKIILKYERLSDYEKTLIAGNLRTFSGFLREVFVVELKDGTGS